MAFLSSLLGLDPFPASRVSLGTPLPRQRPLRAVAILNSYLYLKESRLSCPISVVIDGLDIDSTTQRFTNSTQTNPTRRTTS